MGDVGRGCGALRVSERRVESALSRQGSTPADGRFGATRSRGDQGKDHSVVVYNDRITVSGIPDKAYEYMLGSRSGVEWIMDRYQVKVDKALGIVNDPNDWSREVEDPMHILDLLGRVVTMSVRTVEIVGALPPLDA